MRIIYPLNPINSKEADEPYQEEYLAVKSAGVDTSLFDFDALQLDEFKPEPKIETGETLLYRGWMLNPAGYEKLVTRIKSRGATPLTSVTNYIKCHHLPGWYEQCKEFTAQTVFLSNDQHLVENIAGLDWEAYFIKDFVKSNSTERGSIASTPEEAIEIVNLIKKYRGEIEGGIAVRKVEMYLDETEIRYFVMKSKAYSPTGEIPEIVTRISRLIDSPFYSIDMVQRDDGLMRLVEIGDGQVSSKKTWDTKTFTAMLVENA